MTSIDLYEDFNDEEDQRMGDYEEGEEENADNPTSPTKVQVEAKEIKVKKRKLITLNAERLKGPRGIVAIDEFFGNIKLKGRGHEAGDLKEIIRNLEHWAFRMFPKYNFDDALAKIEKLGRKREVAVHMTRYRMNQLSNEDDEHKIHSDDEEKLEHENAHDAEAIDEFDELLNQQIALSTTTFNTSKMSGISAISQQPKNYSQVAIEPPISATASQPPVASQNTSVLTDEQRKRIEENRQRALKIREAKLNELKQKEQEEAMAKRNEEEKASQIFSDLLFDDDFE